MTESESAKMYATNHREMEMAHLSVNSRGYPSGNGF